MAGPIPPAAFVEFVVGTGGATLYEFTHVRANSEARGASWGVAMFTLNDGGYQWQFIPVDGAGLPTPARGRATSAFLADSRVPSA